MEPISSALSQIPEKALAGIGALFDAALKAKIADRKWKECLSRALHEALSDTTGLSYDTVQQHLVGSRVGRAAADTTAWTRKGMRAEGIPRPGLTKPLRLALHFMSTLEDRNVPIEALTEDRFRLVHLLAARILQGLDPLTPDAESPFPGETAVEAWSPSLRAWEELMRLDSAVTDQIATVMPVPLSSPANDDADVLRMDRHDMYIPRRLTPLTKEDGEPSVTSAEALPLEPLTLTHVEADGGVGKSCLLWRIRTERDRQDRDRQERDSGVRLRGAGPTVLVAAPSLVQVADEPFLRALETAVSVHRELGRRPVVLLDSVEEVLTREGLSEELRSPQVEALVRLCVTHELPLVVACRSVASTWADRVAEDQGLARSKYRLEPYSLETGEIESALLSFVRLLVPDQARHDRLVSVLSNAVARGYPILEICQSPLRLRLLFETGALPLDRPVPLEIQAEALDAEARSIDALSLLERDYTHRVVKDERRGVTLSVDELSTAIRQRDLSHPAQDVAMFLLSRGRSHMPLNESVVPLRDLRQLRPRGRAPVEHEVAVLRGRNVLRSGTAGARVVAEGRRGDSLEFVHQIQFDFIAAQALFTDSRGVRSVVDRLLASPGEFFLANVATMALVTAPSRDRALLDQAMEGIEKLLNSGNSTLIRHGVRCYAQSRLLSQEAGERMWQRIRTMGRPELITYFKDLPTVVHVLPERRFAELRDLWDLSDPRSNHFRLRILRAVIRLAVYSRSSAITFLRETDALTWLCEQDPDDHRDATLVDLLETLSRHGAAEVPSGADGVGEGSVEEMSKEAERELSGEEYAAWWFWKGLNHLVEKNARLTTVADAANLVARLTVPSDTDRAVGHLGRYLKALAGALRSPGKKYRGDLTGALGRIRLRIWMLQHGTGEVLTRHVEQELAKVLRAEAVSWEESDRADEAALGFAPLRHRQPSSKNATSPNNDEFVTVYAAAHHLRQVPVRMAWLLDLVESCPRFPAAQHIVDLLVRPVIEEEVDDVGGRRIALARFGNWLTGQNTDHRKLVTALVLHEEHSPARALELMRSCLWGETPHGPDGSNGPDPFGDVSIASLLDRKQHLTGAVVASALVGSGRAIEAMDQWARGRGGPGDRKLNENLGRQCHRFFAVKDSARNWLLQRWRNLPAVEGARWLTESAGDRLKLGMCALGPQALSPQDRTRLNVALSTAGERRHNPHGTLLYSTWATLLASDVVGPPSPKWVATALSDPVRDGMGALSNLLNEALLSDERERKGENECGARWTDEQFHDVEPFLRACVEELRAQLRDAPEDKGLLEALAQVRRVLIGGICRYPRVVDLTELMQLITEPPTSRDNVAPVASLIRMLAGSAAERARSKVTTDDLIEFLLEVGRGNLFLRSRQERNTAMQLRPAVYGLLANMTRSQRRAFLAECSDCSLPMVKTVLRAAADIAPEDVQALLDGRVPTRKDSQEAVLDPEAQRIAHQMVGARSVDSELPWHELIDHLHLWWGTEPA